MYHVGGMAILFRCLIGRGTMVLRPDFPLHEALTGITHVSLVSTQLQRLLRSEAQFAGLKAILLGGSAIPRGLIAAALDRGLPIHVSYGLTEMASQVATTRPHATRHELQTSGRILRHRQLQIAADGTLLVRGKTRFIGYVEGRTLIEPFLEDGWFATGDVGHFTKDGLLTVSGRVDNMFVSGGENVMPEEIEDALTALNIVERAVVVDVDDEEFGRRPVAFVDVGESVFNPSELRAALVKKLPAFKIPRRFFLWPERNAAASMKVDRGFFRREADALMRRQES
jgi:O-succinylbenzoic acid--CoA ligase